MRKALIVIAIAGVALTAWCVQKRLFQDDEKKIRGIIEDMRKAAEFKSADRIIGHFSNHYSDKAGNSKLMIYGLIKNLFGRVDEIRIKTKNVSVTVAADRAWVKLEIVTEATREGNVYYPFGSDQEPETPTITFKKTRTGEWKIIKVENVFSSQ